MTSFWSLSDSSLGKGGINQDIGGIQPGAEDDSGHRDALGTGAPIPSNGDCASSPTVRLLGYQNPCGIIGSLGTTERVCDTLLVPMVVKVQSTP